DLVGGAQDRRHCERRGGGEPGLEDGAAVDLEFRHRSSLLLVLAWLNGGGYRARWRLRTASFRNSSGGPEWTIRPFAMTMQRFAVARASSRFCSTIRIASPLSSASLRTSCPICWTMLGFTLAEGSSTSITFGR